MVKPLLSIADSGDSGSHGFGSMMANRCVTRTHTVSPAPFPLQGQPRFRKAREIVHSGQLGTVSSVRYHMTRRAEPSSSGDGGAGWRVHAADSGGGLVMDVGCHALDILDFVLGPLQSTCGHAGNVAGGGAVSAAAAGDGTAGVVEDNVAVTFRVQVPGQPRLAVGSATWCFSGFEDEDRVDVQGDAGRLTFSVFGLEPLRLSTAACGVQELCFDPVVHVHQPLVQLIVDELRGGRAGAGAGSSGSSSSCGGGRGGSGSGAPLELAPSRGDNAVRVAQVLDDALAGYYCGRTDSFWARPASWAGQPSAEKDADAVVARAKVLVRELYDAAGVDDSHGTLHVLKVLGNLEAALEAGVREEGDSGVSKVETGGVAAAATTDDAETARAAAAAAAAPAAAPSAPRSRRTVAPARAMACRLAALLHDADDKKYFPATCTSYANAERIAHHAGAPRPVVAEVLRMIDWVSCSHNGNQCPPEARLEPELLWPRWADRLEAVGEIGVARCYLYNCHKVRLGGWFGHWEEWLVMRCGRGGGTAWDECDDSDGSLWALYIRRTMDRFIRMCVGMNIFLELARLFA